MSKPSWVTAVAMIYGEKDKISRIAEVLYIEEKTPRDVTKAYRNLWSPVFLAEVVAELKELYKQERRASHA